VNLLRWFLGLTCPPKDLPLTFLFPCLAAATTVLSMLGVVLWMRRHLGKAAGSAWPSRIDHILAWVSAVGLVVPAGAVAWFFNVLCTQS
jgi:hypothetical protein